MTAPAMIRVWGGTIAAVSVMAMLIVILAFGSFSRRESVQGYVEPDGGLIRVRPAREGTVQSLSAATGRRVNKGDVLAVVNLGQYAEDGLDGRRRMVDEAKATVRFIEEQLTNELSALPVRQADLERQAQALARQKAVAEQRAAGYGELEKYAGATAERMKQLESQGFVANSAVEKAMADVTTQNVSVLALGQEQERLNVELVRVAATTRQLQIDHASRVLQLKADLARARQSLEENSLQQAYTLIAPVAGEVAAVRAAEGDAVKAGVALISLAPEHARYHAVLLIPSRAMAYVRRGLRVEIEYDAFPHSRYGTYGGTITEIDEAVVTPQEQSAPVTQTESVYRVIVELDEQAITAYQQVIALRSDMTLQAHVIRDRRKIYEWIADPLLTVANRIKQ
ncbi:MULTISPECIES: HlyD family secretion protein [unclassified Roseateles]|jgi:membrane fusion protein|uniref:HlyD family secretion protein n=1 Tax=unclassified Roseateles TaxID=2626991 RepID=UPI0016216254|nr:MULTISPECIES: HlyD family efflux transporter periplasmic adaptor subunit [unclassified Roseateles]MBB3284533.1 membrane fusion protein [Mitsuaria sp. BK037]